jgi:cell wall-associated NlpC family hydrolase
VTSTWQLTAGTKVLRGSGSAVASISTSSRRRRRCAPTGLRRSGGALFCSLLISLALGSGAQAATLSAEGDAGSGSAELVGHTVLATVITATNTGPALNAIADSLALVAARFESSASAGGHPADTAPPPKPAPAQTSAGDPSSIPPASAGTNGTTIPPEDLESVKRLDARSPQALDPRAAGPTAILLTGIALAPPQAPDPIKGAISAANTIVGRPYVWGGGHGSWYSSGYDCSGAVSFALFGGGFIPRPLTSTELESWGAPGPGRWLTVYASPSHTYAVIAGLRWDTVGDASGTGPRWHLLSAAPKGFVARHVPGY